MTKSSYTVEVLVNGGSTKEYSHEGATYVEGKKGTRFSLRFRNNSGKRVLFVPTIDGISVIDGKDGSLNSRGYIVDAYGSTKIDGWRKSDDEVAEFYFSSIDKSYSVKMKRGKHNVGIIGVAVYEEKEKEYIPDIKYIPYNVPTYPSPNQPWHPGVYPETWNMMMQDQETLRAGFTTNTQLHSSVASLCATSSNGTSSQSIGTGWGETKTSKVVSESFDRKDSISEVFRIYYNTKEGLNEIGVDLMPTYKISKPKAFKEDNGYCKEPEN